MPTTRRSKSASSIQDKYNAQREFFATNVTRSFEWRERQLKQVLKFIEQEYDEIAKALTKDLGKCAFEGEITEIEVVMQEAKEALENFRSWSTTESVGSPGVLMPSFCELRKEPRGVTLNIGPFNYPFSIGFGPAVTAFAAGCTVILKPSEACTAVDAMLQELVPKYFEPEVCTVVSGGIPEATELLSLHWDLVFFTGSETVGKIVAGAAAKTLSPVVLELGGKAPLIIDEDMPELKAMANRVMWGKTINAGQTCVAPDYILCHTSHLDKVIAAFKESLSEMFGSTPSEIKSSSFARNVSTASTQRLVDIIDDAVKNGGEIITGGSKHANIKEKFFPPTLILNPPLKSKVMSEEIFGCVLPIIPYSTQSEAIDYIRSVNGASTPLALYVFTRSRDVFTSYMDAIPSGDAVMNDVLVHFACSTIPFGGMGTSGYGRAHGKWGFDAFTHTRGVLSKPCRTEFEFAGIRYPPYDKYGGWSGPVFKFLARYIPTVPVLHSKYILGFVVAGIAAGVAVKGAELTGVGGEVVNRGFGSLRLGIGYIGEALELVGGWLKKI